MGFRHVHVYTNDYLIPCEWFFVMYISVRMTTISLYMGFRLAHSVQMTFHILCIWIFVMHISVRMTIHILFVFPSVQCSSTRE